MSLESAPRTSLAKRVFRINSEISSRIILELDKLSLGLLDTSWIPEYMEDNYLNGLEKEINSGKADMTALQDYFTGYSSLREVLLKNNDSYNGYNNIKSNGVSAKLHSLESDKKFTDLIKLAKDKGYDIKADFSFLNKI